MTIDRAPRGADGASAAQATGQIGFFVVPPLKGEPIPQLWTRSLVAMLLNGTWGFGTAFLLRLAGAGLPLSPEGKKQHG